MKKIFIALIIVILIMALLADSIPVFAKDMSECVSDPFASAEDYGLPANTQERIAILGTLKDADLENPVPEDYNTVLCVMRTTPVDSCYQALDIQFNKEINSLMTEIKNIIQSKKNTSSQMNMAIARYGVFSKHVREMLQIFYDHVQLEKPVDNPDLSNAAQTAVYDTFFESYSDCSGLADSYLTKGQSLMIKQLKTATVKKKTTIMMEKYKAINSELRELNTAVVKLYAFFMTLNNKLKAFTSGSDMMTSLF